MWTIKEKKIIISYSFLMLKKSSKRKGKIRMREKGDNGDKGDKGDKSANDQSAK